MKTDSEQSAEGAWREMYLAALFEPDPAKLLERFAVAKRALNRRERELWYSVGDHAPDVLSRCPAGETQSGLPRRSS
jgi:hypothetical protein